MTNFEVYVPGSPRATVTGSVELEDEPTYDALKKLITPLLNGGDLEHVRVWHNDQYTSMFVDETGGPNFKSLPINQAATAIYRANVLVHRGGNAEDMPAIYGPAVLFDRNVWF